MLACGYLNSSSRTRGSAWRLSPLCTDRRDRGHEWTWRCGADWVRHCVGRVRELQEKIKIACDAGYYCLLLGDAIQGGLGHLSQWLPPRSCRRTPARRLRGQYRCSAEEPWPLFVPSTCSYNLSALSSVPMSYYEMNATASSRENKPPIRIGQNLRHHAVCIWPENTSAYCRW